MNTNIETFKASLQQASGLLNQKNYTEAKEILESLAKESIKFEENQEIEYYNFDDPVDFRIFSLLYKTNKSYKWLAIPFLSVFSYLSYIYVEEKNFLQANIYIKKAIRWAPLNLSARFEKCEIAKIQNDMETFKNITLSIYDMIYNDVDLARYYRNLGYYYIEKHDLNLAYALFTASLQFDNNPNAYGEIAYINGILKRDKYIMSAEEGKALLKANNIPFGVNKTNANLLVNILNNDSEFVSNPNIHMLLLKRIYGLTKDNHYSPYVTIQNSKVGLQMQIPRIFKPLKSEIIKEKLSPNNVLAILTSTNALFQCVYDGKCLPERFEEVYKLNIDNALKNGLKVLKEKDLNLNLEQGTKLFKLAIIDVNGLKVLHGFTLINNIFVDFSIPIDNNIDYNDVITLNNSKNVQHYLNMLSSIKEIQIS